MNHDAVIELHFFSISIKHTLARTMYFCIFFSFCVDCNSSVLLSIDVSWKSILTCRRILETSAINLLSIALNGLKIALKTNKMYYTY